MSRLAITALAVAGTIEISSGIGEFVRKGEWMKTNCSSTVCTHNEINTKRIRSQDGICYIIFGCSLIGLSVYCSSFRRSRLAQQKKKKAWIADVAVPPLVDVPLSSITDW